MRKPCPLCGSTHFGSQWLKDNSLMRYCHGYFADTKKRCAYTWHESEDHLHFEEQLDYERVSSGQVN